VTISRVQCKHQIAIIYLEFLMDQNSRVVISKRARLKKRLMSELAPFTLENLPLNLSGDVFFNNLYAFHNVLGAGAYGIVISAIEKKHLEQCAIKIISKDLIEESEYVRICNEAEVLSKLDNKNIVKFHRVHQSNYHFFIVMELIKGGSLHDLINLKGKPLNENECCIIMKQVFNGIAYLRSMNLLHRDLKLANILLTSLERLDNSVKLIDFGFSTSVESEDYSLIERCGTICYMAPEIIEGKKYSYVISLPILGC